MTVPLNLTHDLFNYFNLIKAVSPKKEIYIYYCPLGKHLLSDKHIITLKNILSSNELIHAKRYQYAYLKVNSILSRGILRILLADFLNINNPKHIIFKTNSFGKPYIESEILSFSVSHCDSMLIIAISNIYSLGIDIENKNKQIDHDLAEFVLSNEELSFYHLQDSQKQHEIFLKYWTRKESYLKAMGTGLVDHLNKINTVGELIIDHKKLTPYKCYDIYTDYHHITSLSCHLI